MSLCPRHRNEVSMDERKLRLKQLKKERKKEKRRYVTLWKFFAVLFLILAILFSAAIVAVKLFSETAVAAAVGKIWDVIAEKCRICAQFCPSAENAVMGIAAAVLWVLHIVAAALWSRGKKKWKKSDAYLSYKTLKSTIKQEKEER